MYVFCFRKVLQAQHFLRDSSWFCTTLELVQNCISELGASALQEIICYGLGNFSECLISRYQLGLLLEIQKYFQSGVLIYDPVFTEQEKEILRGFNCSLINYNEHGRHKVKKISLIYLPHCPKELTDNFLWSNWGLALSNCIIFGNSIANIITSKPRSAVKNKFKYIYHISQIVKEFEVANTFKYQNIFNDTSIHIFPLNRLLSIDCKFWESSIPEE
ncbi:hypothetical protein AAG570_007815 [Ranatra chinensis]|uniref:SRR1-like domain-containing protein n=1 Tax=Ranatra chinensis TaxID=642074 RepID=A0ABD0XUM0_9HEMI